MSVAIPAILIALAGGITIGLQSQFSGTIGQIVGIMEGTFVVHLGGLILSALILILMRGGGISAWREIPWYALCAGFIGVAIIASISYAVPRLGLATTLTLSIVAQLVLGAVLDHFGWLGAIPRPLDLPRAFGMLILFAGTWLIIR